MPKLWTDTVDDHRRAVREATIDATAALVARNGLASVTMAEIARTTGIGRATLYKYFPDVDAILLAWHERHILGHLAHLEEIRKNARPGERLRLVLTAYAHMSAHRHDAQAAALHRTEHASAAERRLGNFLREIIVEAVRRQEARADIPAADLAAFCVHALSGAASPSPRAAGRLVTLTLDALRPR
ncbi:MAG TPA: helix-turn-helix domain-containing protein [Bauldia sp.]|nr:helix-turn-helix domain-containing protein [Bauldia sp.]